MMHKEQLMEMTAKTVEEAIELAIRELGVARGEVEIEVISKGKSGILGIGGEPARVKVTAIAQLSKTVRVSTDILNTLISKMDVSVLISLKNAKNEEIGGPEFDIDGDDSGLLIGRRGETLKALQFLVNLMTSRRLSERVHMFLDVAGYQERRYKSLQNLAGRVAQKVLDTGHSITLEPMPPNERRIVHMTLAEHPGVNTVSTGVGSGRQIVVEKNNLGKLI